MSEPPTTVYYVRFDGPRPGLVGRSEHVEGARHVALALPIEELAHDKAAPGQLMSTTYSAKDVGRLFGLSESRLRYWDKSGFLSPTGYDGRKRCYTFQDLIGLRSAKTLLEGGVSLRRVRRIVELLQEKLPRSIHPLGRLRIMSDSKTIVVADSEQTFEPLTGQLLLDFQVHSLEEDIVAELPGKNTALEPHTAYEWYLEGCQLDEDEASLAEAEQAYHMAIHLDPTLANAYTNLGNLLYRTGSTGDAKALYEKALEVDTNQPEAHYNLGFLEFEEGNMEVAEQCFTRAVDLDSTFADAHFNVAMTMLRLGRDEEARGHLLRYLSIEPAGPWADIARRRLKDMGGR